MRCPFCAHEESKVTDSRTVTETHAIRRRRECLRCLRRFTTFETIDLTMQVLKRDGRYEDFQEQKLLRQPYHQQKEIRASVFRYPIILRKHYCSA